MPPTRSEQVQLDELLSDIYKGIEALPDQTVAGASNKSPYARGGYIEVKEYELPASSPLVRQHKQALAALRSHHHQHPPQPQRSTLKRHTPAADPYNSKLSQQQQQQQPQSLATFITSGGGASVTPDSKRRVRILDPSTNLTDDDDDDDDYPADDAEQLSSVSPQKHQQQQQQARGQQRVKYVNTNKFIYHQERNPDDEASDADSTDDARRHRRAPNTKTIDLAAEDDDVDGLTQVEYYHTSWLDRQLGRASRRRSSKELNERQVKEKAMIEELKRSLKNGAITLRQSFKGNNKRQAHKSESFDEEQQRVAEKNRYNKYKQSSVFGSGLATIPRNYSNNYHEDHTGATTNNNNNNTNNQFDSYKASEFDSVYRKVSDVDDEEESDERSHNHNKRKQRSSTLNFKVKTNNSVTKHTTGNQYSASQHQQQQQHQRTAPRSSQFDKHRPTQQKSNYSTTLPHNYNQQQAQAASGTKTAEHQLLKSHYRTSAASVSAQRAANSVQQPTPQPRTGTGTTMRDPNYQSSNTYCPSVNSTQSLGRVKSPLQYPHNQHLNTMMSSQLNAHHQRPNETISSLPSASEVVRSALSRSGSQVSVNQLNKTMNLLSQSPQSPMSPTQHLHAASPSLSPSPFGGARPSPHQAPKSTGLTSPQHQLPGMIRVTGTRTLERPAPVQQQQQPAKPQPQQSVYANPHTSLMQHRQDQQSRQPNKNVNSIREFNELDSLLRSLSPSVGGSSLHVTPGFSSKPAQPAFGGYGGTYTQQPTNQQQYRPPAQASSEVYAQVNKNPAPTNDQSKASYLQQHYMANSQSSTHQPFTIDVTDKKDDENCSNQRSQNLSEFEPPIELLPSMEDYQNISKLNPVKNHYWYKPNMSRDKAISLLKDKPQGTFIVRDSTSFKGAFGLAVKVSKLPKNILRNPNGDPASELIRHFLIEPTVDGVRLKGYSNEPVFSNLANLIYQHSLTELALPCRLVIPRADIEDPKFNQKQKQYYDEFIASKEHARHNPYERTSPNGGYRRYPGDVYVHNEHRIIFE